MHALNDLEEWAVLSTAEVRRSTLSFEPEKSVLLVAEDDERMARALSREFAAFGPRVASSVAEALAILEQHAGIAGAVLDITLPDGSGLEILTSIRERGLRCPVLVLTSRFEPDLVAAAQLQGAEYLPKPASLENLHAFGRRLEEYATSERLRDNGARASAERRLRALAERCYLTAREVDIVRLALGYLPRSEIAGRLGITGNTLKTHIRAILRKTEAVSVRDLVTRLHEDRTARP